MSRLARFKARHPRRTPPPYIDHIVPKLRAASQRCDELLGPALDMVSERRRLARWFKLGALASLTAIVYLVRLLHPDWPLAQWVR